MYLQFPRPVAEDGWWWWEQGASGHALSRQWTRCLFTETWQSTYTGNEKGSLVLASTCVSIFTSWEPVIGFEWLAYVTSWGGAYKLFPRCCIQVYLTGELLVWARRKSIEYELLLFLPPSLNSSSKVCKNTLETKLLSIVTFLRLQITFVLGHLHAENFFFLRWGNSDNTFSGLFPECVLLSGWGTQPPHCSGVTGIVVK